MLCSICDDGFIRVGVHTPDPKRRLLLWIRVDPSMWVLSESII
jgi:hypothetical protein